MVEVSLTVGKLDASLALLLTKDHHLIEFPTILLPDGITTGSIVKITCDRDLEKEKEEKKQFTELQEEIFELFGKYEPTNPVLKTINITQTSCVLEWEPLNLGTSELKELTLYKNGSKLGPVKNPFQKKNIKFSGLPIDTPYKFQLKLETSSGIYYSNVLEIRTHKMTDLSGITVCIGDIDYNQEHFTINDIENAIKSIGAKPISSQVRVDTTQFICTKNSGIEYQKAKNMNIPIIRPEWLKACQLERRIVGVNKFYLDTENPIWNTKDFWIISNEPIGAESTKSRPAESEPTESEARKSSVPEIIVNHADEENVNGQAEVNETAVESIKEAEQADYAGPIEEVAPVEEAAPVEEIEPVNKAEPIEENNLVEEKETEPVEQSNENEPVEPVGEAVTEDKTNEPLETSVEGHTGPLVSETNIEVPSETLTTVEVAKHPIVDASIETAETSVEPTEQILEKEITEPNPEVAQPEIDEIVAESTAAETNQTTVEVPVSTEPEENEEIDASEPINEEEGNEEDAEDKEKVENGKSEEGVEKGEADDTKPTSTTSSTSKKSKKKKGKKK